MQQEKIKIDLSGVSETLLIPLWARAKFSEDHSPLLNDSKAIEIVKKIDYDFSTHVKAFQFDILREAVRAKQFDDKIKAYITDHPRASIVNIGAGLDSAFYRVDNGLIQWYDLDLPVVINVRRQLLPEPDRVTYIAKSLLDPSWCKDINAEDGVFMIAGGALGWFDKSEVERFFSMLADNFPDGEIVFDAMSRLDGRFRTWMDNFPPEQQDTMRTAWMDALKGWWEKAPQNQKDTVSDMIAALKTPIKPKGKEWADIEAWWNWLNDKERQGAVRDLMESTHKGFIKWAPEDANEITKWDNRVAVIDQFPLYRDIPRDLVNAETRRAMDYSDESGGSNIIHLRV